MSLGLLFLEIWGKGIFASPPTGIEVPKTPALIELKLIRNFPEDVLFACIFLQTLSLFWTYGQKPWKTAVLDLFLNYRNQEIGSTKFSVQKMLKFFSSFFCPLSSSLKLTNYNSEFQTTSVIIFNHFLAFICFIVFTITDHFFGKFRWKTCKMNGFFCCVL